MAEGGFFKAASPQETVRLLAEHGSTARLLAGGSDLRRHPGLGPGQTKGAAVDRGGTGDRLGGDPQRGHHRRQPGQRLDGGTAMGGGAAISESLHPYYSSPDWQPAKLGGYAMPTTMDVPDMESVVYEVTNLPATPEKVLRALDEKAAS